MKNSEMAQCSIIYFLYQYNFHFWETLVFQVFPRLSKNGCKEKRDRSDKIASNDKNNFRFSPLFCRKAALKIGRTVLFFPKWRRNVSNGQKKSRSQFPGAKSDFCRNSAAVRSESLIFPAVSFILFEMAQRFIFDYEHQPPVFPIGFAFQTKKHRFLFSLRSLTESGVLSFFLFPFPFTLPYRAAQSLSAGRSWLQWAGNSGSNRSPG